MFELKKYCAVQSLDQADEMLHADKKNVILGGLLWMKMSRKKYNTGIDLSRLGLDGIKDTGNFIEIGCMTSLRQMEISPILEDYFGLLIKDSVAHIVGVQFRNLATIGGSVYSKFGFSDILTALMILDAQVHLHRAGLVPLEDFLEMPPRRDILVNILIPKKKMAASYQSHRMTATDFPVLNAAVGCRKGRWKIALGARPGRAKSAKKTAALLTAAPDEDQVRKVCDTVVEELAFGSNARGSRDYRKAIAKVLVKRGIEAVCR